MDQAVWEQFQRDIRRQVAEVQNLARSILDAAESTSYADGSVEYAAVVRLQERIRAISMSIEVLQSRIRAEQDRRAQIRLQSWR